MQEAVVLGSLEALLHLLLRGVKALYSCTSLMKTTIKAWSVGLKWVAQAPATLSPQIPLWNNPCLPHIPTIPDPHCWANLTIKTMARVVANKELLTFDPLYHKFRIPNFYRYKYIYEFLMPSTANLASKRNGRGIYLMYSR